MEKYLACPQCGSAVISYRNPAPTTDVVIYDPQRGIVLVERNNEPLGHALPGGFIDEGETIEHAAVREMGEETSLKVTLRGVLGVYSNPQRDPRRHTLSVVFVGQTQNPEEINAGDDAKVAAFYPLDALPSLVFDHGKIVDDFRAYLRGERHLCAIQGE